MLYSVVLGDTSVKNNWKLGNDDYSNPYIGNDDIHQRIRFGKNVKPEFSDVTKSNDGIADIAIYDIPSMILFSNNNKNMNLNIVNFWSKDKNVVENHKDDNIIYITLSCKTYKLLQYQLSDNCEIVQTYHMKNTYVGCAITFSDEMIGKTLMTINSKNDEGRYNEITIQVSNDNVVVSINDTLPKEKLVKLTTLAKKYADFSVGFRMDVKSGKMLTKTYITDEEHFEELKKRIENIKNSVIICIAEPFGKSVKDINEDDVAILDEKIVDEKIRAITLYGVKVPKDFCKEFKILYMFNYNSDEDKIECVRSN